MGKGLALPTGVPPSCLFGWRSGEVGGDRRARAGSSGSSGRASDKGPCAIVREEKMRKPSGIPLGLPSKEKGMMCLLYFGIYLHEGRGWWYIVTPGRSLPGSGS